MPSARSVLISSTLAATALAQSTSVTSLFLYGYEGENLVASVVAAAPAATTYFVSCAPGTDATDCGLGQGVDLVSGPSTLGLHYTEAGAFTEDVDCKVVSQTTSCVQIDGGDEANAPGTATLVLPGPNLSNLRPVTITAGLELLSGGGASATTSGSGSSTSSTAAASGASATDSAASKTTSATTTASAGSSSATSASSEASATGAANRASGSVVLAGLAGLVGIALVL